MTKPKGQAAKYSQSALEKALAAVNSKTLSVRKAAVQYGILRSTLQDKLLGRYPVKRISHTVLSAEEEAKLVKWIVMCARLGEGKDREQLCRTVQTILNSEGRVTKFTNNKPGYQWYKAFMERHKDTIRERKAMTLGEQRAQVSEKKIRAWFKHTETMLFNDGVIIGARWTFKPWEEFDADFTLTPNGWINSAVFMKWLQYTFLPAVDHLQRPVVLFLDGHSSHMTQEVHDFAQAHSITVYVLPSHSSHIVQPLDLVFFGCLKHEWKLAVKDYKAISRFAQVTKHTFTVVFADAWKKAYSPEKLINAFRASGLCPWNPNAPDYTKCEASALYALDLPPPTETIVEATSLEDPDLPPPESPSTSGDARPPPESPSTSGDARPLPDLPPPDSLSPSGDARPLPVHPLSLPQHLEMLAHPLTLPQHLEMLAHPLTLPHHLEMLAHSLIFHPLTLSHHLEMLAHSLIFHPLTLSHHLEMLTHSLIFHPLTLPHHLEMLTHSLIFHPLTLPHHLEMLTHSLIFHP
ncbi:hypothetical protein EGW08_007484 [Elysia chlorotica]|uniref:HTH CENPB-type domain-containing protein n=1 Tax=Elysia chlorotica TaxID=188477 RepID=A0A3S1BC39_ELYCH|nr:hypothetical protein EGW08_007484 [Elysia chlorotica]